MGTTWFTNKQSVNNNNIPSISAQYTCYPKWILLFGIKGSGKNELIEYLKQNEFEEVEIESTMYEFGPFIVKQLASMDTNDYSNFSTQHRKGFDDELLLNGYCRNYNLPKDVEKLITNFYQIPIIQSFLLKDRNTHFNVFNVSNNLYINDDWIYCLQQTDITSFDTQTIVLFINLSDIDQFSEINGKNKISETLKLLKIIIDNLNKTVWTRIIVLFKNQNEFEYKINKENVSILICPDFKGYLGAINDCFSCLDFVKKYIENMVHNNPFIWLKIYNLDKYFNDNHLKLHRAWELIASDACISPR